MNATPDATIHLLRHTLATLAYRAGKVLRDAPDGFGDHSSGVAARTPSQLLAHMGDLMDWALSLVKGPQKWADAEPLPWDDEVARFFAALSRLDAALASESLLDRPAEQIFQGPIADALTHVGQLALLRRMAGRAIRSENYFKAQIDVGRVGLEQPAPRQEF